jgi:hypothetical protein
VLVAVDMADPASILGLIAASLTITIRAATIGKDLHSLTSKYYKSNSKVKQLSVHVAAVRVAARSLSSWLEDDAVGSEEVEDVKRELLEVLSACCNLLSDLQDHVAKALAGAESVGFKGAITYIWDEDIIRETAETLHHQETALILMLQALGQLTRKDQRAKLRENVVVQTLTKAKRPSSSIFGIRGDNCSSVRLSYASENSEKMDTVFTFDTEVMSSTAYRNAFTSLFRRNLVRQLDAVPRVAGNRDSIITVTHAQDAGEDYKSLDLAIEEAISTEHQKNLTTESELESQTLPPTPRIYTDVSLSTLRNKSKIRHPASDKDVANIAASKSLRWPALGKQEQTKERSGLYYRALYDYDGDAGELCLRKGDVIQIITLLESGWWDGVSKGVRGWVPSNYCAPIHNPMDEEVAYSSGEENSSDEDIVSRMNEEADKDWRVSEEAAFWIPQATSDGKLFYFNTLTGVKTTAREISPQES